MDFEFSAEQEELRASLRRFLADRAPITPYVRGLYAVAAPPPDAVWRGLADLGVVGLLVPGEHGGAGMGMVDAAVALEELGRAVCPAPFVSSAIGAVSLVVAAGDPAAQSSLLPGLASGATVGTVALYEPGRRYEWRSPATAARADGDGWVLDGEKTHVPDAAVAGCLLVVASDDTGLGVYTVAAGADGLTVEPASTVDGSRKEATVRLAGVRASRIGSGDATEAVARTVDRLAVASVVDGVGTAARALELAVEYAKERVQFDRPIGSFQAVQHLCTDMLRTVELGRAAGYYACWAADEADPAEAHRAATMAKAYASEAFPRLGGTAIQVFGGIGFTWEHDIHLFYKRLLSCATAYGGADDHLAELAALVL